MVTKLLVISHAGVKRINRAVYACLHRRGVDVTVVVPSKLVLSSGTIVTPDAAAAGEAEIIAMRLDGTNPRKYFYPELPQWLASNMPDVILLENDPASNLGFRLAKWCKANNRKLICQTYDNTPRGIWATKKLQGLKAIPKNLLIHLLNFRMGHRVHALLVVNRDSAELFRQYRYNKILQIPLGYDKSVFYPDSQLRAECRSRMDVSPDTILVAFFGRLVPQKGVHLLIEALTELRDLTWKLLLDSNHDSEHSYSSYIRRIIEENEMTERVIYFGANHYEIADYMRAADIMVAPSLTTPSFKEQYGRAVQEAMACGCVAVVSDSGHPKDLVGDSRLVFNESDVAGLRKIIRNLMTDQATRVAFSNRLQERATDLFGIDSQSNKLKQLIETVIAG